jgi:hypothetical protein
MSHKIRKQVMVARTPVHISTPLPEAVLDYVVEYVNEKFDRHEKAIIYKSSDEEKKIDTLVITLLDVAADLFSARQEINRLKQLEADAIKAIDETLNKHLDDFT